MFGKTAIYTSLNRMDDASKIPGSELHRTNLTLRASSSFGKMTVGVWMQKYSILIH